MRYDLVDQLGNRIVIKGKLPGVQYIVDYAVGRGAKLVKPAPRKRRWADRYKPPRSPKSE